MLRNLIVERLRITAHKETRMLPIYALLVQKNGHKLRAAEGEGEPELKYVNPDLKKPVVLPYPFWVECHHMTMPAFAAQLSGVMAADYIDRKVVDETGLAGAYDFVLKWYGSSVVARSGGETVFESLERNLGLRLEPRRGPVETLVIDSASRIPLEN
jgi:uncharacterized protein (TIGR03435 family)